MPGLQKFKGSSLEYRAKVPADVREKAKNRVVRFDFPASGSCPAASPLIRIGTHAKVSLRTRDESIAVQRTGLVIHRLEATWAMLRAGPVTLSHRQMVGLSRKAYLRLVELAGDHPGAPADWLRVAAWDRAVLEGATMFTHTHSADALPLDHGDSNGWTVETIDAMPRKESAEVRAEAIEMRFGEFGDWTLDKAGIILDQNQRPEFLTEIGRALLDASERLARNAVGDYRPDTNEQRFPSFERKKASGPKVTLVGLFERWRTETKPAGSTVTTWRAFVVGLGKFLAHDDAARVNPDDTIRWKDSLVASGISGNTINRTHLSGMRALYAFGLRNKLVTSNPFVGVKVQWRRPPGTKKLPYSDEEIGRLLSLARAETHDALHWLPLLCVCTGARAGEVAQLWGSSVRQEAGLWTITICPAPDAGTIKNEGSERTVPIHPALIDAGFLAFVGGKSGPLFYGRSSGKTGKRHASKGVVNRLASWIRENGFTDPRKAPNHAMRHWFKTACIRASVPEGIADHIQGHAARSDADGYRHYDMPTLADAVARIPIPTQR